MATITKVNLDTLFARIDDLEEEKATKAADIKEAFESFVSQYAEGGNEKALKIAVKANYKKYKDLKKDRAKFILIEAETDQLTEKLLED